MSRLLGPPAAAPFRTPFLALPLWGRARAQACAHDPHPPHALSPTHARSSVASEWIKGKPIDECLELTNTDIAAHLKLPPVKLHCSMLAEDAIKAAVKDYRSKSESA